MKIKKGFILRIEDITKEEHLKRIENWAPVAQKLAHGIKNPLSTILGAVEQLEIKYNKEEGVKRYIELVKEEILRLKKMSDAFMKFTKLSPPMFQPKNINELIKNVMTRYETICTGTGIKVEYELDNNLPLILIDEEGIANVLNIIIENGIEAMEKGGILRIKTATMERFEKEAEKIKNYLRIEVSDTGKGIPEKYLNKVFDPYFTYDKPFGTGLGLTLAKRIVENHKGFIEITSKEGVGTTVSVYLPLNQNV
uniref:histidine kinase n=1 Tax=candidate division WOR-3 bacterium TaxID=2052148 RepID=A0A7C3Z0V5_UNCW3